MAKDIMKMLRKLDGAVNERYNPYAHVIRTPSPSVNFTFGKAHGLPLGFTLAMFGPPKGGKSVICNAMIGQLHRDDPSAIALKYNTEFRETAQLTDEQAALWGIDFDRYVPYDVNHPEKIFDAIEKDVAAACQEDPGKIKLIVIDSINMIQGRRATNADTVMTQQIGDLALTLKEGFKRILPIQRQYRFAVVLTAHVAAEMDQAEQMRGNKVKMAAGYGVQHYAEYFMMVEPNRSKEGKQTLLGEKLENTELTDMMDKAERTGHKIRAAMKDSSMGPKGRVGEFTLDYNQGIINRHEEVFLLGVNRNVINKPNNQSYEFGGKKWVGKPAMVQALQEDQDLRDAVLSELKRRDLAGSFAAQDTLSEEAQERLAKTEREG